MTDFTSQPLKKDVLADFAPPVGEPDEVLDADDRPKKPTEDEIGDELITSWGGKRKFFYGAWHRYDGGVWKVDQKVGKEFWRILKAHKKNGIKPKSGLKDSLDKYCRDHASVDEEEIDVGANYINLRNGVYNLTTDELESHRPDLYMTSQLPFDYDPEAHCDVWWGFLNQVLRTPDGKETDTELWRLAQEAFGYSLTADTSHRVSFWCVGASGTGKSTLLNVLIALMGDSHVTIDLDTLKDNQYQLADIAGRRVVTFTEPDTRSMLADGWYKKLVSRDTISARQAYGKPFNFVPVCKLWGAMNETPRVADRSDAIYSRVVIIPMNRIIPIEQRDGRLDEKLRTELAGIFNWALGGLKRLRTDKQFTSAKQSIEARNEYKHENDIEAYFVEERCELAPANWIATAALYAAYDVWCKESGFIPKHKLRVGREWKRLGFQQSNSPDGKTSIWKGVRLKPVNSVDLSAL